jgi:tRNA/tmRNA/rRNA uracil-C5-methylase (TrmA/RlmC/RlmD family)
VPATPPEELLELQTGAIAAGGGCVARTPDGMVVFVRHALPGERVRARVTGRTSKFLRADAIEVLEASPERVDPPCPYAGPGRCGGCDFEHVALPAQRRLKASLVDAQLQRVAGVARDVVVEPVAGDDEGLRWRTRIRVAVDRQGRPGFRRHRSHQLQLVDHCPIASPSVESTGALSARWPGVTDVEVVTGTTESEAATADAPTSGAFVHVFSSRRAARSTPALPDIGTGIVLGHRVLRPPGAVHHEAAGHRFRVSAGVFWQVHRGAAPALVDAVLSFAGDCRGRTVVDLYAGVGLFAVALAVRVGPEGSVLAVERDRRACADARHNGAGLASLRVLEAAVTAELVDDEIGRPELVVLDPAREGAGTDVMRALSSHAGTLRRVVYVACDPASFARDARVLLEAGWELRALRAFDIFPMTEHVELVAAFDPPGAAAEPSF